MLTMLMYFLTVCNVTLDYSWCMCILVLVDIMAVSKIFSLHSIPVNRTLDKRLMFHAHWSNMFSPRVYKRVKPLTLSHAVDI